MNRDYIKQVDILINETIDSLCRMIGSKINNDVPDKIGDFQYARRYALEKLIERLQKAV